MRKQVVSRRLNQFPLAHNNTLLHINAICEKTALEGDGGKKMQPHDAPRSLKRKLKPLRMRTLFCLLTLSLLLQSQTSGQTTHLLDLNIIDQGEHELYLVMSNNSEDTLYVYDLMRGDNTISVYDARDSLLYKQNGFLAPFEVFPEVMILPYSMKIWRHNPNLALLANKFRAGRYKVLWQYELRNKVYYSNPVFVEYDFWNGKIFGKDFGRHFRSEECLISVDFWHSTQDNTFAGQIDNGSEHVLYSNDFLLIILDANGDLIDFIDAPEQYFDRKTANKGESLKFSIPLSKYKDLFSIQVLSISGAANFTRFFHQE